MALSTLSCTLLIVLDFAKQIIKYVHIVYINLKLKRQSFLLLLTYIYAWLCLCTFGSTLVSSKRSCLQQAACLKIGTLLMLTMYQLSYAICICAIYISKGAALMNKSSTLTTVACLCIRLRCLVDVCSAIFNPFTADWDNRTVCKQSEPE